MRQQPLIFVLRSAVNTSSDLEEDAWPNPATNGKKHQASVTRHGKGPEKTRTVHVTHNFMHHSIFHENSHKLYKKYSIFLSFVSVTCEVCYLTQYITFK